MTKLYSRLRMATRGCISLPFLSNITAHFRALLLTLLFSSLLGQEMIWGQCSPDTISPTAKCKAGHIVALNTFGQGALSPADINDNSFDNCGAVTLSISTSMMTCDSIGTRNVTLTVKDGSNNTNTCVSQVTVVDNLPPTIACPQNVTVSCGSSTNPSATGTAIAVDNCGGSLTPTYSDASGSPSSCSSITRTWSATYGGLTGTCVQTITVVDNIAPVIDWNGPSASGYGSGPANVTVSCMSGVPTKPTVLPSPAIYYDSLSCSSVTLSITDDTLKGTNPSLCNFYNYAVNRTFKVTDACGNFTQHVQVITVIDTFIPVITVPAPITVPALSNCQATVNIPVTVTDCADSIYLTMAYKVVNDINGVVIDSGVVWKKTVTYPAGKYTITYSAIDPCGNHAVKTLSLTISDGVAPTAVCKPGMLQVSIPPSGITTITPAMIDGGSTDNCTPTNQLIFEVTTNATIDCSRVGRGVGATAPDTAYLKVTDGNGNFNTCYTTLQVVNNSPPAVFCKSIIKDLSSTSPGTVTVNARELNNGSFDACDADGWLVFEFIEINGVAKTPDSLFTFPCDSVGKNIVRIRVTELDDNQTPTYTNYGYCTDTITIRDITKPTAVCRADTIHFSLDSSGMLVLNSTQINALGNASSDNCNITWTVSPTMFTCANVGDQNLSLAGIQHNNYSLTVTDASGNTSTATCNNKIVIKDYIPPVLTCAPDTISIGPNPGGLAWVKPASFVSGGLFISSGNSGSGSAGETDFKVTVPNLITLTFNWSYTSSDNTPADDPFGYFVGSTFTQLTNNGGGLSQSGSATVTLIAGSTFGFRAKTVDNKGGEAQIWIRNFSPKFTGGYAPNKWTGTNTSNTNGKWFFNEPCGPIEWKIAFDRAVPSVFSDSLAVNCDSIPKSPIPVTLRATDKSGNQTTCSTTLTVIDKQAPQAQCQPVTVALNSVGQATVPASHFNWNSTDVCSGTSLTFAAARGSSTAFYPSLTFKCDSIGTHTVVLRVTDGSGNNAYCQTSVTIIDQLPPAITCPSNITINCSSSRHPNTTGWATYVENCPSSADTLWWSDSATPATVDCQTITRTWRARDGRGNISLCFQTITVVDTIKPQLDWNGTTAGLGTPPASSITVNACAISAAAVAIGVDNCTSPQVVVFTETDTISPDKKGTNPKLCTFYNYKITRKWKVTDNCGNKDSVVQVVTVQDTTRPAFTFPASFTFNSNPNLCSGTANISLLNYISDCAHDTTLTVTYQVGSGPVVTNSVMNTSLNVGTHTITVTATDPCSNVNTTTFTVLIKDTESPVAKCKTGPIPISLNSSGVANISPADVNNNSTDNCGVIQLDVTPAFFDCSTTPNPKPVTLTVRDAAGNFNVCTTSFQITNISAPAISCPGNVTVNCNVFNPGNPATSGGSATVSSACSTVTSTYSDAVTSGAGNCRTILRTWSATNSVGTSSCTQTITVIDTVSPVLVGVPKDTLVDACKVPAVANVTATDNCTLPSPGVTVAITSTQNPDTALCSHYNYAIRRIWTITDGCNSPVRDTQDITVQDTLKPVFAIPNPLIINTAPSACTANVSVNLWNYISDCAPDRFLVVTNNAPHGNGANMISGIYNPGDYSVKVIATDPCGNKDSVTFTLRIRDNQAPQAACKSGVNLILDGSGNGSLTPADIDNGSIDNCGAVNLSISPSTFNTSQANTTVNVTLTVTDNASPANSSTCTTPVKVYRRGTVAANNVSGGQGSTINIPISITGADSICALSFSMHLAGTAGNVTGVGGFNLPGMSAADFNVSGNNVTFSWISGTPVTAVDGTIIFHVSVQLTGGVGSSSTLTIDGTPTAVIMGKCGGAQIPITTINGTVTVVTVPVNVAITGSIKTENNANVQLVDVALGGTTSGTTQTGVGGTYGFNVPSGSNATITPAKDINDCNGINVLDVLALQLHILGAPANQLPTPYRRIAADVNGDGTINVLDRLALHLIVLAGNPCIGLSGNTSWRFVDAAYTFPNPLNPFAAPYPQSLSYTNVTTPQVGSFIGIKIGDLDLSANPANLTGMESENRSTGKVQFEIENLPVMKGTEVRIPIKAKDFTRLSAYQFTIGFEQSMLTYKDMELGTLPELTKQHFGLNAIEEGKITSIWYVAEPTTMTENDILFTLVFDAKADASGLSRLLSVLSDPVSSAAYNSDLSKLSIDLVFTNLTGTLEKEEQALTLYQNIPNPFTNETIIPFYVPNTTTAVLTITDVSGRTIKQVQGQYPGGRNEIRIERKDLPANGLFFYRLETNGGIAVKRMILLD